MNSDRQKVLLTIIKNKFCEARLPGLQHTPKGTYLSDEPQDV